MGYPVEICVIEWKDDNLGKRMNKGIYVKKYSF